MTTPGCSAVGVPNSFPACESKVMPAGSVDAGSSSHAQGDDPPSHASGCSYHWFHVAEGMLVVVIRTGFESVPLTSPLIAIDVIVLIVSMSGPRSEPSVDG